MRKLLRLSLRLTIIALLIAAAAYIIPTPYVLRAPGHAVDLTRIISVQGGRADHPGHLYMTTVIYEKANLLFCLYSLFEPYAILVPQDDRVFRRGFAPGVPAMGIPEDMMEQSKLVAKVVALRRLGYHIRIESTGVRVIGFLDNVPAATVLRLNDIIDVIDGVRVLTVDRLRHAIRGKKPGDPVKVQLRRNGKTEAGRFPLVARGGKTIIGIITQDAVEPVKLPKNIQIATHNVNGASAGLMFTLEIIDQLTPDGITRGHAVAGTGTMELNGTVGPIEGTELKQVAAERKGASVFLVPEENQAEVKLNRPGLKVIPVHTLDDALHALEALPR